jgi:hypothetical protein
VQTLLKDGDFSSLSGAATMLIQLKNQLQCNQTVIVKPGWVAILDVVFDPITSHSLVDCRSQGHVQVEGSASSRVFEVQRAYY